MCNFFFSSRRRHTRFKCDWSSDVCSSDLARHLGHTLSQVDRAHHSNLQFAGIFLSGHKHCSPPFNVIGPLISCLTFGVHSTLPSLTLPHENVCPSAFDIAWNVRNAASGISLRSTPMRSEEHTSELQS